MSTVILILDGKHSTRGVGAQKANVHSKSPTSTDNMTSGIVVAMYSSAFTCTTHGHSLYRGNELAYQSVTTLYTLDLQAFGTHSKCAIITALFFSCRITAHFRLKNAVGERTCGCAHTGEGHFNFIRSPFSCHPFDSVLSEHSYDCLLLASPNRYFLFGKAHFAFR